MANVTTIYVTNVEKCGHFLKIWGQVDKEMSVAVEKTLQQVKPQFDQNLFPFAFDSLQVGAICIAKYRDEQYYRAKITNITTAHQHLVEVLFIDYGNRDFVALQSLCSISKVYPGLVHIQPQAKEFILANITHHGSEWDDKVINLILNEFRYLEFQLVPISQIENISVIKMMKNNEDIAMSLFTRGIVLSVATSAQYMMLQSYVNTLKANSAALVPPSPPITQPPVIGGYKGNPLEPGSEHPVYVSYVSDGPCDFYIQLQKMEENLIRLMQEINKMNLVPLEDSPVLPGTVCVARCQVDDHICRAVVTNMVDGQYKVFYVDFGNTEVLSAENLFNTPFKFVIPKVMAMRYSLAGLDRQSVTVEMKCAFKNFVNEKLLRMRVMPAVAKSSLPQCVLWDQMNVNVLDVMKQAALVAYPEPLQLSRGFTHDIKVCFVYSCNRFYVQLKSKEEDLRKMMHELQLASTQLIPLQKTEMKVGLPCCAYFEQDALWYRAEVVKVGEDRVDVCYIDYGNVESVSFHLLRKPLAEHLTLLRPQALECCLNGYQNMEGDLERDNLLEQLILEKECVMKVIEMIGNRALVDLIDETKYNVASRLLEKIAAAHSQASPMLVQENNHIEQRQPVTSPNRNNYQSDFRSSRDGEKGFRKDFNHDSDHRRNSNSSHGNADMDSPRFNKSSRPQRRDFKKEEQFNERNRKRPSGRYRDENGQSPSEDSETNWRKTPRNNDSFEKRPPRRNDINDRNDFRSGNNRNEADSFNSGNKFEKRPYNRSENSFDSDNKYEKRPFNKKDNNSFDSEDRFDKRSFNKKDNSLDSERSFNKRDNNFDSEDKFEKKSFNKRDNNSFESEDRFEKRSFNRNENNRSNDGFEKPRREDRIDFAPRMSQFTPLDPTGRTENVSIIWFHNPGHFYCQLDESKEEIRLMMEDIQKTYVNCKPVRATLDACYIALFKEDRVLYRAKVLELLSGFDCKVQFTDFGNVAVTNKVWPLARKFLDLPSQAVRCGLKSIAPIAGQWEDTNDFASYFDKETFRCTFDSNVDETCLVKLECDSKDVAEELVIAGLAKYANQQLDSQPSEGKPLEPKPLEATVPVEPKQDIPLEVPLLVFQTIQVTVTSVESLEQFTVCLETGHEVSASLHNLSDATVTYEDVFKEWMGAPMIAYVDNVENDKLQVTFYDTAGMKLKFIEPDEGAYETIDLPCPLPVLSSNLSGWVSSVSTHSIFVQSHAYSDRVTPFLEQLTTYYGQNEGVAIEPGVGVICVVHSTDDNYYRARVVEVKEEEMVGIMYLDYGNYDEVALSKLKKLEDDFYLQHILALEVFVKNAEAYAEQTVNLKICYGDDGWSETTGTSSDAPQPQQDVPDEPVADVKTATSGISVILSHQDSPSEFYLQLYDALDEIEQLQATLQEQVAEFVDLENPCAGVLCAAPYSVDQQWYRAQVLDADGDITTVRFVDYGNTDVLTTETKVKTLSAELLAMEQHARRYSLNVSPVGEEWSHVAHERFETLTTNRNIYVEIVYQDEKTTYVELYADEDNVGDILVKEGHAEKMALQAECGSSTAYISHLNSPSEFWIQLESAVADLEWVAEQLANATTFPESDDLTPGSLCAARFPDDDLWYRARILSNTVAGLEVLFIDYGNTCNCNGGLRQLPEELILVPALAQKCSLQKPSGYLQWPVTATERFREISADGATVFTMRKLSVGETTIVELLLNGASFIEDLLPVTEGGHVSQFKSMSNFVVTKESDGAQMSCALESLPGFKWNEKSNEQFAKLISDGTTQFQVEFVSETSVRLYLDGQDIRVNFDATSESAQSTPPKRLHAATVVSTPERESEEMPPVEGVQSSELTSPIKGMQTSGETSAWENVVDETADDAVSKVLSEMIQSIEVKDEAHVEEAGVEVIEEQFEVEENREDQLEFQENKEQQFKVVENSENQFEVDENEEKQSGVEVSEEQQFENQDNEERFEVEENKDKQCNVEVGEGPHFEIENNQQFEVEENIKNQSKVEENDAEKQSKVEVREEQHSEVEEHNVKITEDTKIIDEVHEVEGEVKSSLTESITVESENGGGDQNSENRSQLQQEQISNEDEQSSDFEKDLVKVTTDSTVSSDEFMDVESSNDEFRDADGTIVETLNATNGENLPAPVISVDSGLPTAEDSSKDSQNSSSDDIDLSTSTESNDKENSNPKTNGSIQDIVGGLKMESPKNSREEITTPSNVGPVTGTDQLTAG